MQHTFSLYDPSIQDHLYNQQMTWEESANANRDLRSNGSDCRWILLRGDSVIEV